MLDAYPPCPNDAARLVALHAYGILDTPAEQTFDGITWLAQTMLDAPMSAISLVDRDRQWFKSHQNFEITETARSASFCTHALLSEHPFIVLDALADPRFSQNPMVTGAPHVRFYLGMPLISRERFVLGALCVYDTVSRKVVTSDQLHAMNILARQVIDTMELRKIARHDGLTNLLSAVAFRRTAAVEVERARRYGRQVSVTVLDIDHFKTINDTYGHAAGDYILRNVAAIIKEELRPFDIVGRTGGEEFAILFPDTDFDGALAAAERLRQAIAASPIAVSGTTVSVTASLGVADCRCGEIKSDPALAQADHAMYRSKKEGRNRVTAYASEPLSSVTAA
ncbi:MAG: sensor domain-containing diguanylate cyclase [Hyphomicrobiaceae bacterium]|nr:sensor domain-containing diguanylate cyclase [Hyphomicrobiaceae bacterium]